MLQNEDEMEVCVIDSDDPSVITEELLRIEQLLLDRDRQEVYNTHTHTFSAVNFGIDSKIKTMWFLRIAEELSVGFNRPVER